VELSKIEGVELMVVVPDRWKHYGRWRPLRVSDEARDVIHPTKVRWPWLGPAQFYLHWYPQLKSLLKSFRPDVIDVWEEPWGLISLQAARVRARHAPHAKLVLETEQNINKKLPTPFEWIRRKSLQSADWLVSRNAEGIDVCRAKGYRGPATVLPNAVDAELFGPMDVVEAREALGFRGHVLGYIGRLVPEKGLAGLVDAMARLPSEVSLVLIGDGPMRSELTEQIQRLDLGDRVQLIGRKPLNELPRYMNAIDALMLPSLTTPSWKEQFGRVIIEAFACGTPVIGSDSGAIAQVIADDGWVFREGDTDDLARCVHACLSVPDKEKSEARARRRERVLQEFTWGVVAQRYVEVYRAAMSSPGFVESDATDPTRETAKCL
jgi:glycosyltransferase involved in cell wall biosynthesis